MTTKRIKEMMEKPIEELVSPEMAKAIKTVCEGIAWRNLNVGTPEHWFLYGGDL